MRYIGILKCYNHLGVICINFQHEIHNVFKFLLEWHIGEIGHPFVTCLKRVQGKTEFNSNVGTCLPGNSPDQFRTCILT